jgi:hypothetical protein
LHNGIAKMATPQPHILTPEERLALEQKARYDRITRNIAIGGLTLCPLIAVMPPRKLDWYTLSLGIGFYLSADHLATQYNGRSLLQQVSFRSPIEALPTEKAKETSRILKEREEAERDKARREAARMGLAGPQKESKPWWKKLWMGDEEEGWRERRMEEERKAFEEGKSYTDVILEQIWEVWTWEKKGGKKEEKDANDEEKKE